MLLSLNVNPDDNAANKGRRFNLNANNEPDNVAPVVVGKPKGHSAELRERLRTE